MEKIKEDIYQMAEIGKMSCSIFHDILNPISGLLLYLETINEKELEKILEPAKESSQKIREFIKIIQKNISENTKEELINVNSVAFDVIKIMKNKALVNKTSITLVEKEKLIIWSKEIKIYQVLINLISNAIDACSKKPNKGQVTVLINKNSIIIKDNGVGISSIDLPKIFKENFSKKKNGLGIGLYFVKNITEKDLGGNIKVKSDSREGTEFILEFPGPMGYCPP
jgi:signal transduction histidine kinase